MCARRVYAHIMSNKERCTSRLTVLFTPTIRDQAEHLANAEGRSVGSLVRRLVAEEYARGPTLSPGAVTHDREKET